MEDMYYLVQVIWEPIWFELGKRDDNKIRLDWENIGFFLEVDIDDLKYKKEDDWA